MKWIFVGASTIASQYMIGAVRAQTGCDVTWVVSGSGDRTATWAQEHGIANHTASLGDAFADADAGAVYISSTNEKHHAQAMAAIAADKHVLREKPLGMTLAEAEEMVAAAKDRGTAFATNHHLRCSASHRAVRDPIPSGALGHRLSVRLRPAVPLPEPLQD